MNGESELELSNANYGKHVKNIYIYHVLYIFNVTMYNI